MADELLHVKQVKNRLVSLQYFDIRLFPTTGDDPKSGYQSGGFGTAIMVNRN
jgi:hypothetical protein